MARYPNGQGLEYFWQGLYVNTATLSHIGLTTALAAEALILSMRGKPVMQYLTDGSALVTALIENSFRAGA